jgi:type VI secretion system protein ImpM
MRCGLYGKLPAKRDFVAVAAPREFLDVWEPWLQSGVSASKLQLGQDWKRSFLRAPIWRFWLGADLCGVTVAGAFMPSVDGVGRYFPLTVLAAADRGEPIPPPETDPQYGWFERLETFLLGALDERGNFDAFTAELAQLPPPAVEKSKAGLEGISRLSPNAVIALTETTPLPEALATARQLVGAQAYALTTFWWTVGGEGIRPVVIVAAKMPDAQIFVQMLTGVFSSLST